MTSLWHRLKQSCDRTYAFFALALLPFVIAALYAVTMTGKYISLEREISKLDKGVKLLLERKGERESFAKEFSYADANYITTHVASFKLLEKERDLLVRIQQEEKAPYEPIQERLAFLTGGQNRMEFLEGESKDFPYYRERLWKLASPVEVNGGDLAALLSLLEGPNPLRPDIVVKQFSLKRKGSTFLLDLELVQRDCYATH